MLTITMKRDDDYVTYDFGDGNLLTIVVDAPFLDYIQDQPKNGSEHYLEFLSAAQIVEGTVCAAIGWRPLLLLVLHQILMIYVEEQKSNITNGFKFHVQSCLDTWLALHKIKKGIKFYSNGDSVIVEDTETGHSIQYDLAVKPNKNPVFKTKFPIPLANINELLSWENRAIENGS